MKKAIILLGAAAIFASCQKKDFTCACVDVNDNIVFKKTMSELNYSEFQTYCANTQVQNQHVGNGVTCTVREATKEDKEE